MSRRGSARRTARLTPGLAALAVLLLSAAPAGASAPAYAPPVAACVTAVSGAPDATVWGAGTCGGRVTLSSHRPSGSWRVVRTAFRAGLAVEAVAADSTGVFVVVSCTSQDDPCNVGDPLGKRFLIGKVPYAGAPTPLTDLGSSEAGDSATVAARDGRWWAAFTQTLRDFDRPGSGSRTVLWRKTFGGAATGTVPVPADPSGREVLAFDPSIALTAVGAVLTLRTSVEGDEPEARQLQLATASADGRFTTAPLGPAQGATAEAADVAWSGGRTFVAWSRGGRPALAFERDGRLVRTDLPYRGRVVSDGLSVAASGSLVSVVTTEAFAYREGRTSRTYARSFDATGTLQQTVELTAAAGSTRPYLQSQVTDGTAARGRATVSFAVEGRTFAASQG